MPAQLGLSLTIRFVLYFVHWMVLAHLPVLLKLHGFSDLEIGLAIGLFALSSMALMLPMGLFADYFSSRRAILLGAGCLLLYLAGLQQLTSLPRLLLPVMVIGGIGVAALVVVTEALFLKLHSGEERGRRIAVFQLSTYLGFGLGPLVGGILLQHWQATLFPVALSGGGLLLCLCLFLVDHPPLRFSFRAYGQDLLQLKPLLLMACIFILGTHFGIEQTSLSLLMGEGLGFSAQQIGLLFAGLGLWMAAVVPFIGRLHDRQQPLFLFLLGGMAVSGIFQIITAWAYDFKSLLAVRLIHTLGDAIALLELSVLIALFFPVARLGGNSGLLYAIRTLATFLAALAAGLINRQWSYGASFLASGLLVLLFVACSWLLIAASDQRRREMGWR